MTMLSFWPWPSPNPVILNSSSSNSRDHRQHLQLQRQVAVWHSHVQQMPGLSPKLFTIRVQTEISALRKLRTRKRMRMRSCWLLHLQTRSKVLAPQCY